MSNTNTEEVRHPHEEVQQLAETAHQHTEATVRMLAPAPTPPVEDVLLDWTHVLVRDLQNRIIFWNRGAERLYGWTAAEALGHVSHTLLQTVFPVSVEAADATIWEQGEWSGELRHTCRDGFLAVVASRQILQRDAQGNPIAILEINHDITAQKQAELAERRLASIVESSEDAILSKTLDGIITSWNAAAQRLYGYSPQEAIGQPIALIVPPEKHEELQTMMQRLRRGEEILPQETVRVRKDGTRVPVSLRISPIKAPNGAIVGASTIARDITARMQAETQMQQLHAQAQAQAVTLETTNTIALDILSSRTGVEALAHIVEAARRISGAQYGALGVKHPDTHDLMEFITDGLEPEAEAAIGVRPRGHGVLGLLLRSKEPLRLEELSAHPASAGFPPHHPPMHSFLGVPILQGDTVVGSLYLTDKEGGGAFTKGEEAAVQALGAYAAVAIQNLHMLLRQRDMMKGLIHAQEEERKAVAYDLHDGLTQYVMAAHAHFESFQRVRQAGKEERASREFEQGLRYLKDAVTESRRLVNGLRALALDDLGLAGALEQLVEEEKQRAAWESVVFYHNISERRFEDMVQTAIYRVAQEALTNARKYARTPKVRVSLLLAAEEHTGHAQLSLEVRDWGQGFVLEEKLQESGRVGLKSMRERILLLGGYFELHSAAGEGTRVRAVLRTPPHQNY